VKNVGSIKAIKKQFFKQSCLLFHHDPPSTLLQRMNQTGIYCKKILCFSSKFAPCTWSHA